MTTKVCPQCDIADCAHIRAGKPDPLSPGRIEALLDARHKGNMQKVHNADDLIARAKASLEGVTPGPWEESSGIICAFVDGYKTCIVQDIGAWSRYIDEKPSSANIDFIVLARSLIPELISRIADLEKAVAAAKCSEN